MCVCNRVWGGWGFISFVIISLLGRTTTFLCIKVSAISPRPESPGGQIPAGSSRTQCLLIGKLNERANWKLPAPREAVTNVLKLAVLQHRGLCVTGTVPSLVARTWWLCVTLNFLLWEQEQRLPQTFLPPWAGILPPCHQHFDWPSVPISNRVIFAFPHEFTLYY